METLEPNMYVRTKKAIGKVYQICKNEKNEDGTIYNKFILNTNDRLEICDTDLVVKASHNIIDLIEVGDYVDGCYIQEIKSVKNGVMKCLLDSDYECISTIRNDEISKVLTKQQFESMQYEVK